MNIVNMEPPHTDVKILSSASLTPVSAPSLDIILPRGG